MSQFHYGSIKTDARILKFWINSNGLNSTMVRLKRHRHRQFEIKIATSQFHYGSIKTELTVYRNEYTMESQFHYGSIKTIR